MPPGVTTLAGWTDGTQSSCHAALFDRTTSTRLQCRFHVFEL